MTSWRGCRTLLINYCLLVSLFLLAMISKQSVLLICCLPVSLFLLTMTSKQSVLKDPPTCTFTNWDEFYPIALRYHQSTHPGNDMVIDRIETFRRYMSKDVIEYLDGFVRLHPRFNTSEGWTQWLEDVTEMFSMSSTARDNRLDWPKAFAAKFSRRTVEQPTKDLITDFKMGKISVRQFWQGLDLLVGDNVLSSSEQRQFFWGALSEDEQKRLVERCHYFDPQDEIWEKQDSEVAKISEQKLSQIMEFSVIDERITQSQRGLKIQTICMILILLIEIVPLYDDWRKMRRRSGLNILLVIVSTVMTISILGWHQYHDKIRLEKLKAKQIELLSRDSR